MMRSLADGEKGQASVEYAAICAALIVIAVACGALWRFGAAGGFADAALDHASHSLEAQGGIVDALLY